MSFLGNLDWLDLVLLTLVVVSLGVGYYQGLLRQFIGLAALYIGAVLGAQYYFVLSGWIRSVFAEPAPSRFLNAFCFFIIVAAVSAVINWLAYDAYRSTRLRVFPLLDQLGGALLGLVTMIIILTIAFPVIEFSTGEPWPFSESTRVLVVSGLQGSQLLPVFVALKPVLLSGIGPWLPAGLPSIFNL